jgi:hypothetical protein
MPSQVKSLFGSRADPHALVLLLQNPYKQYRKAET